ncbi:muramidase family protein [Enterococcus sp. 5H]|uniref:muramidase family protein n=1 Tax=Enterococcus sp. 5H TaxID=1229490 RepID=UPI0023049805|nr:LysM peptidoglycan-binding domain-containing protein [Enterococcus sp. 5H]MDA9471685.1 N-acetylmuramoyl-L-alanine amidase family 4 [Enterococcus sp. 5H]
MGKYKISRKERRKAEQNKLASMQLKKGTTVLSSALVVSSIAAPIAAPKIAEATEDQTPSAQIGYTNTQTYTDAVQEQTTTPDSNDSMTQDTQTSTPETDTPDSSSETQDSSELSTSETTQNTEEQELVDQATDLSTAEEVVGPELRSSVSAFSAQTRSLNPSAFIAEIAGHAQSVAAANDLYASVMMAQAILESDWGRSTLSTAPNYNLFGIKGSYQGQSVNMLTWEVLNGQWVQVTAAFRKYPSFSESFGDNAYVLRNTSFQAGVYFYSGAWKSNTNSYQDATAWLTGRYATDPSYNTKLNNIITTYNLTQYDTPSTGGNTGGNTGGSTGGNNGGSTGGGTTTQDVTHTVKAGDSLWALASQYGTTIANIKSWNNLSGDVIYVGQKLIVGKGTGNSGSGSTGGNTGGSTGNNTGGSGNTSTTNTYYTVKSGDSLWAIANANGVSIANLRQWNNISGDIIHPGQRLIVKQGSTGGNSGSTGGNTGGSTGNNTGGSGNTSTTNTYYTVKSGDSLWAIANANGVSIANLRQWNSLSGDIIYPGQRLIVKQGSTGGSNSGNTGGSTGNTGSSNNTSTANGYYTVKSGDSLWAIANANGVSIVNLRQWNNISGDIIHPGQRLIVKQGSTGSSTSSNSQSGSSSSSSSHKVKSGDTLWDLAQTYGTSVQKLKQLNGLSSDVIYIGQTLKVK